MVPIGQITKAEGRQKRTTFVKALNSGIAAGNAAPEKIRDNCNCSQAAGFFHSCITTRNSSKPIASSRWHAITCSKRWLQTKKLLLYVGTLTSQNSTTSMNVRLAWGSFKNDRRWDRSSAKQASKELQHRRNYETRKLRLGIDIVAWRRRNFKHNSCLADSHAP